MPWWSIGISVMATQMSTNSLLGTPAVVARSGLTWLQLEFETYHTVNFLARVKLCARRGVRVPVVVDDVSFFVLMRMKKRKTSRKEKPQ